MGLLIVVLENTFLCSSGLKEMIGLLVIQIGKLYEDVSDEIKMLLLKILLEVSKEGNESLAMVRNTNGGSILRDCLTRA